MRFSRHCQLKNLIMTKSGSYTLEPFNSEKHESRQARESNYPTDSDKPVNNKTGDAHKGNHITSMTTTKGSELFEIDLNKRNSTDKPIQEKCKQKFRFLLCSLAVLALTISMVSRVALNIAIEDMNKKQTTTTSAQNIDKANIEAGDDGVIVAQVVHSTSDANTTNPAEGHKEWSTKRKQFLMGAFYIGYFPVMTFSGYLAEKYGAKGALLIATGGTGIATLLTPTVVDVSFELLVALRMALGVSQATLIPGIYAFINRWLTETEISIFASMIKVAMSLGVLFGYLIPGIIYRIGYGWRQMFYFDGMLCLTWAAVWLFLATSTPGANKHVEQEELDWIMRKKSAFKNDLTVKISNGNGNGTAKPNGTSPQPKRPANQVTQAMIYKALLTHVPVYALAFTKFTHNVAIDFVMIELTTYLKKMYHAESDQVSSRPAIEITPKHIMRGRINNLNSRYSQITVIGCLGSLTQVLFVTSVGWLAKVVVQRKLFGFSRTVWRKCFQGFSNFGLSVLFFYLAFVRIHSMVTIGFIMVLINVFWMFGVGGEAVAANDMSLKYPATIYGLAHSFATLAGIATPMTAGIVLDNNEEDFGNWRNFFCIIASTVLLGGLAFVFGFKAKRFLPGEVEEHKPERSNGEVATSQAI